MTVLRGGDKLEAALKEIAAKVAKPCTLRVGFLEGATYPNGTPVAAVAAFNEFGTSKAPPRPFFRPMVADKSPEWGGAIEQNLIAKNYDVEATLNVVGDGIKGQLQQSIRSADVAADAPSTVKRKGFSQPLIDTGHMLASVDYEVKS